MTRKQRLTYLALAALVAAAAFLILRPSGESSLQQATSPVTATTPDAQPTDQDSAAGIEPTATPTATPTARPAPKIPTLTAGKVRRLKVSAGDTVRFAVRSRADDEIHVHGYDHSKAAPAGKTVRMAFKADIEGVFEIELEHAGTPIAELEVRP